MVSKINASQIEGTLAQDQIPNLDTSKITSGVLPVERGGTGVNSLDSLKQELGSSISTTVFNLEMGQGQRTIVPSGTSIKPFFGVIVELEDANGGLSTVVLTSKNSSWTILHTDTTHTQTDKMFLSALVSQWNSDPTSGARYAVIEGLQIYLENLQNEMWTISDDIKLNPITEGTFPSYSCTLTFLHWGN